MREDGNVGNALLSEGLLEPGWLVSKVYKKRWGKRLGKTRIMHLGTWALIRHRCPEAR